MTSAMNKVSRIYIISITLAPFQNLTARFANAPELKLFSADEQLWSLSIGDLDILTLILGSPAKFMHYMNRRLQVEKTAFRLYGDEMDLLGYYLVRGLHFENDEEMTGIDALGIAGLSGKIDRYVFERFELGGNPDIPKSPMPTGFEDFVDEVERNGGEYSTDCAIALLDLS